MPMKLLPSSGTGWWGFWLLMLASALVVASMTLAFVNRNVEANQAYNLLGYLGPAFIVVTFGGLIVSWIAIFRQKDHGAILIICASIATTISLITIVAEVIEAIMISME